MSEVIRVGLGGLGRSGFGIHGAYLRSDPRFQVVAAADLLPERRAEAKEAFGCRVFENCRSMLEEGGFDVFVNAMPSCLHVEYSLEGLSRGFHVISEKPAAPTVRDFDRIAECARAHGVRFFPFQNSRYQPYFRKIREVISSGVLGEILCIRSNWSSFARRWDWQTRQDQLGGISSTRVRILWIRPLCCSGKRIRKCSAIWRRAITDSEAMRTTSAC